MYQPNKNDNFHYQNLLNFFIHVFGNRTFSIVRTFLERYLLFQAGDSQAETEVGEDEVDDEVADVEDDDNNDDDDDEEDDDDEQDDDDDDIVVVESDEGEVSQGK